MSFTAPTALKSGRSTYTGYHPAAFRLRRWFDLDGLLPRLTLPACFIRRHSWGSETTCEEFSTAFAAANRRQVAGSSEATTHQHPTAETSGQFVIETTKMGPHCVVGSSGSNPKAQLPNCKLHLRAGTVPERPVSERFLHRNTILMWPRPKPDYITRKD